MSHLLQCRKVLLQHQLTDPAKGLMSDLIPDIHIHRRRCGEHEWPTRTGPSIAWIILRLTCRRRRRRAIYSLCFDPPGRHTNNPTLVTMRPFRWGMEQGAEYACPADLHAEHAEQDRLETSVLDPWLKPSHVAVTYQCSLRRSAHLYIMIGFHDHRCVTTVKCRVNIVHHVPRSSYIHHDQDFNITNFRIPCHFPRWGRAPKSRVLTRATQIYCNPELVLSCLRPRSVE